MKKQLFNRNAAGHLLAILTVIIWSTTFISTKVLLRTRRIFAWGLICFVIAAPFLKVSISLDELIKPLNLFNLLFLGICACALCFATWNYASSVIGGVKANFYIYLTPVATLLASAVFLHEEMTMPLIIGTVLTLAGLVISELK